MTGQVHDLAGSIVGRQQVSAFYAQLDRAYPAAALLYVIPDKRNGAVLGLTRHDLTVCHDRQPFVVC